MNTTTNKEMTVLTNDNGSVSIRVHADSLTSVVDCDRLAEEARASFRNVFGGSVYVVNQLGDILGCW